MSHHKVNGDDAAAVTWRGAVVYIQKRKPRMVLLENVEELDRSDGPVSDDPHICELLEQWGYAARVIQAHPRFRVLSDASSELLLGGSSQGC